MTKIQRLAKIKVLKYMLKEYELLAKYNGGADYDRWSALDMAIEALSAEPKTGHWQNNACSNCGIYNASAYKNWCPNCGAKMQEVKENG